MAKEPSIVDKIKADEIAKAEAAEKERIAKEQEMLDPSINEAPKDSDLAKAAADAAAKIEQAEKDENDVPVAEDAKREYEKPTLTKVANPRARVAAEKIRLIAMSYPRTTPDEHVIFGAGGYRYTLGDLRDLTNIR